MLPGELNSYTYDTGLFPKAVCTTLKPLRPSYLLGKEHINIAFPVEISS